MEELQQTATRDGILDFENALKSIKGSYIGDNEMCPLKHHFTDGIYTREIFIPKGTYIVGKIHKHEHPNFLMQGSVRMITETGGYEELKAPRFMISKAGTKRALLALEDTVWITIHHNPKNKQELKGIESGVIAKDYKEYDKFIQNKEIKTKLLKPFGFLINLITK